MKTYIQIGSNTGNDEFYQKICNLNEPINTVLIPKMSEKYNIEIQTKSIIFTRKENKL